MGSKFHSKRLTKMSESDFGIYLNLVEAMIYEVEGVYGRYKENKQDLQRSKTKNIALFVFFVVVMIACPVFLYIVLANVAALWERCLYIVWACAGSFMLPKQFFSLKKQNQLIKQNLIDLKRTLNMCLEYVEDTLQTFYNKSEHFNTRISEIPKEEFEATKFWILSIEADLTVFTDIIYRNNKLNQDTDKLPENSEQHRNHSKVFLINHLHGLATLA